MHETLSPNQRRTLKAREALARKFSTPEQRSQHYREMAEQSHAGRLVLTTDEAAALSAAYRLLTTIATRTGLTDDGDPAASSRSEFAD